MKRFADPDLTLRVTQTRVDGQKALNFVAKTRDPRLGLHFGSFDSKPFQSEPQEHFQQLFLDLGEELRRGSGDWLVGRGAKLCRELLPIQLRRILWKLVGPVRTVQILSDETWIPWELMQLQDPDDPSVPGRFLVEAFSVTRWLLEAPLVPDFPLRRIALVIPNGSGLPKAAAEGERVKALAGSAREVVEIPALYRQVTEALASGSYEGWHFAGHGFAGESPHRWSIALDRSQQLRPDDLCGPARQLGRSRPFVFLNACHSGRGAASLTGMVGMADAFLEAGAGAFLGSHWALEDEQAFCFAEELYRHLFSGEEIGEAVAQARSRLRDGFPGSYDWLAYTVFAHPRACCQVRTKPKPKPKPPIPPSPEPEPVLDAEPEKPVEPVPGEERIHPKDGTILVYVPGGEIVLGDEGHPFSRPLRCVRLSPFWIGKHPITNEQYARYLAESPSLPRPACWDDPLFNGPRLPVVGVSWEEACAYCRWAGLELPTEAQWEAAARGSDRRPFPWGTELPAPCHANFGHPDGAPIPVGALLAGMGPYGTLDQAGNVWEWCADPWAADALRQMKDRQWDPVADGDPTVRALRGGSWMDPASALAASLRERASARRRLNNQGFRCVRRLT